MMKVKIIFQALKDFAVCVHFSFYRNGFSFPLCCHHALSNMQIQQSYWACFGLYSSSCMWKTKDSSD
jgi:hypothetical protein